MKYKFALIKSIFYAISMITLAVIMFIDIDGYYYLIPIFFFAAIVVDVVTNAMEYINYRHKERQFIKYIVDNKHKFTEMLHKEIEEYKQSEFDYIFKGDKKE